MIKISTGRYLPYRIYKMMIDWYGQKEWDKDIFIAGLSRYTLDDEDRKVIQSIEETGCVRAVNGIWTRKYGWRYKPEVRYDKEYQCFYAFWRTISGKSERLYFKKGMHKNSVRSTVATLALEQDPASPHCYLSKKLRRELLKTKRGTVIDLGSAEGMFALSVADAASRVICFDPDAEWNEAVKLTFHRLGIKCECVEGYVDCQADSKNKKYSLDDYFGSRIPEDIILIKMDIEGFEQNALKGMYKTLAKNPGAVLLVCGYHQSKAEYEISSILESLGYRILSGNGKMVFSEDSEEGYGVPVLRHGVLEARKVW